MAGVIILVGMILASTAVMITVRGITAVILVAIIVVMAIMTVVAIGAENRDHRKEVVAPAILEITVNNALRT